MSKSEKPKAAKAAKPKGPGGFDLSAAPFKKIIEDSSGEWMHLRHPVHDHLLYVGPGVDNQGRVGSSTKAKPVRAKILYGRHPSVTAYRRQLERAATIGGKSMTAEIEDEITKQTLAKCIVGFDNLYHEGRLLDASKDEDKAIFFRMAEEYILQVTLFTMERGHFFGEGSKG